MKIFSYRYLPLNVYMGYSFLVVMSLLLGPIEYIGMEITTLLSFITVQLFLFFMGFLLGARGEFRNAWRQVVERTISRHGSKWTLNILLSLGVVASLGQCVLFIYSGNDLSVGNIGQSYVESYDGYERGEAPINALYIVKILEQALVTLALLFGFYYFRFLGVPGRWALIFVVVTYLLVNVVGTGKQKYLGDVVLYAFFCVLISFAAKGKRFTIKQILVAGALSSGVFLLFVEILRQRYSAAGITLENIVEKAHPLISWDIGSPIFDLVGPEYGLAVGVFLGYFTNGLYGLYLSLTLPFEWTYLIGNSYSIGRVFEIFFSSDGYILEKTYPFRVGVTYGWGFDKWHSLFAWLASDVTFPGVLALSSLFGFVYARLWIQALRGSNPFSGPLFLYLSLGLVFGYSNNQLMHSLAGVIVLVILFAGWLGSPNRRP